MRLIKRTVIYLNVKMILYKNSHRFLSSQTMTTKMFNEINSMIVGFLLEQNPKISKQWEKSSTKTDLEEYVKTLKLKKAVKVKDPNAPKRPRSNYIFFCMENRDRVKSENILVSSKEITNILSVEWNDLSDKTTWNDKAAKDKADKFNPLAPVAEKKSRRKTTNERAKSAWQYFVAENKSLVKTENASFTNKQVMVDLGVRWTAIKDGKKASSYNLKATEDKERINKNKPVVVTVAKKPLTAYQIFVNKKRVSVKSKNPTMSMKDVTVELSKMWTLTKGNKKAFKKYEALALEAKETFLKNKEDVENNKSPCKSPCKEEKEESVETKNEPKKGKSVETKNEPKKGKSVETKNKLQI
jgi:structure-specific recognition protein 1